MIDMMKFQKSQMVIAGFFLVLLASIGSSVYFYRNWQVEKTKLANSADAGAKEARDLVAKVGKLMELPTGEEPTVARITDPTKLANQPFFAKAKKGDQVIIYANAKLAILYDPEVNKILNVAPVNIGNQATGSAQKQEERPIRIVLYNGTTTTGLTKSYETTLKQKAPNAQIVDRDNAKKRDYEKSMLVDLAGNQAAATQLAQALGLEKASLPAGETKPEGADFLIILGLDAK